MHTRFLTVLFCALFYSIGAQNGRGCPPTETILPCRCLLRGEEYQIWCSHSDLPKVLQGLRAVGQFISKPIDELILENNFLPALPGRTFFPLKVMRLMLRYNALERVSSDWLAGLETSLMELFIVEPELRTLPDDSLLQLTALEAVTLQTNLMKRLPLFSGLLKLRYLQLESLSLLELSSRNFKDNPSLEKLHISASPRLTRLEANLLRDLPNLQVVNISYCGINWMHPRAITRLPVLKELSLIGNKIGDAGMIGRSSRELPALETIRLDHNYIDKLSEAAFVDLPALKRLYLSNNRITELHHGAFHRVPKLRSLDLNKNMLRRVHPESFLQHSGSGLEELSLIENDIAHVAELRSLLDALPRLTFLDMSYNNLEAIPFGALRGHPTLEHLYLDYNKIHLIDREAFMAMPALRELRLRNNSLSDVLDGPLWNLPALKGLDLSGNFFRRLDPRILANLPSLRRIDLSSNELTVINPEAFLLTPSLEHVNLSYNALTALHPATFRHLLKLYELDVNFNLLLEFVPGLPRGIEYLHMAHNEITTIPIAPSPDLDLPNLRMLDLSWNKIQRIPISSLRTLPQLRRFYMGHNLLQQLEENSFQGLSRMEVLDLQNNRLFQIHPSSLHGFPELHEVNLRSNRLDILIPDVFKNSLRLKRLDISRNQLAEILPGTLDNNHELQMIDASENALVQLSPTFFGLKNLRYLDLTNNRLKNIDPEILSSLAALRELRVAKNFIQELKQGAFHNLQHLKLLNLDNNELEALESNSVRNLPVLKSLKLSHNKLREIPSLTFNNLPALQTAELQENHIQNIAPNAFNAVPYLLMLNLSHNELPDIERAGLRTLRSLEMLDISKNRISRVASPSLEKMEWLVELKMDDNIICGVQGSPFNGMPRLRVLSMRNNKMMSFPEHAVHKLRGNIAVLDIDGNPLACTCNLLWLQAWLQESSTQGPRCVDGSLLRELRLSRQECPEEERSIEVAAPGCEAELLSAPGAYGTSQVFSQWMKLKSNGTKQNVGGKNSIAPLPGESEYFYDDYIDYAFNETGDGNSGKEEVTENSVVQVPLVTSPSKSPHYTAGDTPTIYAASKNKTKPDIPKEIHNSPSTSGFTFFGVPLNFNGLLGGGGTSRMSDNKQPIKPLVVTAERKTAIVNHPPLRTAVLENMHPPSIPEVQIGGFIPVLPGSGGFKPIIPLHLQQNMSSSIDLPFGTTFPPPFDNNKNNLVRKGDYPTVPPPVSVTTKPVALEDQQSSQLQSKLEVLPPEQSATTQTALIEEVTNSQVIEVTPVEVPELETASNLNDTETVTEVLIMTTDSVLPVIESTVVPSLETLEVSSTAEANTLVESWVEKKPEAEDKPKETAEGSSLSALLVPGGQQPQFRQAGRSTVTKVQSPHASASQSNIEIAQVSEPLPHNREGKTTHENYSVNVETLRQVNDDKNWYFANYNKTNLEPYVGRIQSSKSNTLSFDLQVLIQLLVLGKLLV